MIYLRRWSPKYLLCVRYWKTFRLLPWYEMANPKKTGGKPKKERAGQGKKEEDESLDSSSSSSDDQPVEPAALRKKRERGREAFFGLLRNVLALIPLGLILAQQPFMMKPRQPGVNRVKVVPLHLAACGSIQWAATSAMMQKNDKLAAALNTTARVLLTPHEYIKAKQSKLAMPAEKTFATAFKKAGKTLPRIVDNDTGLQNIAAAPMPNVPLIGAYLSVVGAVLAVLVAGAEYLLVIGCAMLMQGCRTFGMEPQPEMYVAGVVAVLGIVLMDAMKPKAEERKRIKRR